MTFIDRASVVRLLEQAGGALAQCTGMAPPDLLLALARARDQIAGHPIPWTVTLHLARIDHRHGADIRAASSHAGMIAQVAAFCREWWDEIEDGRDPVALDDEIVMRTYFEAKDEEYLTIETFDLAAPQSDGSSPEVELTLVLSSTHIAAATATLLEAWAAFEPDRQPVRVADTGFGWFIPSLRLWEDARDLIPPDLTAALDFARAQGCRFLLLDRDGPEVEGLDRHDW